MSKELSIFVAQLNTLLKTQCDYGSVRINRRRLVWLKVFVREGFFLGFRQTEQPAFAKVYCRRNTHSVGPVNKIVQVSLPTNTASVKAIPAMDPSAKLFYSTLGGLRYGCAFLTDISGGICCFKLKC
jgi:hypothetical protein